MSLRQATKNQSSHEQNKKQHILWSCVALDDVILAEAGEDLQGGAVAETTSVVTEKIHGGLGIPDTTKSQ
jgi:hypothetical protein